MNAMMKAAVTTSYDVAPAVSEVERPTPGAGQVLVRIQASGVNPLDTKIFAGQAEHAKQPLPAILGIDMAGVVEAVGADVTAFHVGDAVMGMTGGIGGVQGSLAEFAAVDARLIAPKPAGLSPRDAASLPLVFITAWEGLVDQANLKSGERVLVIGGGGVGGVAVQIARSRGATVFAVDGAEKAAYLEHLGATPIDRAMPVEDYVRRHTDGRGFDVVFDTVGQLDAAFKAVRRNGRVVSSLGWGTFSLAPLSFRAATYSGVFTLLPLLTGEGRTRHGEILRELGTMKIEPNVDPRHFTLATVADAYAALKDGTARGKLVVDVGA